ncbi:MAG: o-succinylbenzoate synthase, partial [Chloroflexota bacterium]|nr:o-succinylbenzoate synthase [Chloroflexota bacterium]
PICLDESIHSAEDARRALDLGSCRILNIKAGRLGGLVESIRAHDVCVGRGVPVWCGGMLETNIGRAFNVALSTLPGFSLPGDVAASERYFERDIALPGFELTPQGTIQVPQGPGIGVEVDDARLEEVTLRREEFRA